MAHVDEGRWIVRHDPSSTALFFSRVGDGSTPWDRVTYDSEGRELESVAVSTTGVFSETDMADYPALIAFVVSQALVVRKESSDSLRALVTYVNESGVPDSDDSWSVVCGLAREVNASEEAYAEMTEATRVAIEALRK